MAWGAHSHIQKTEVNESVSWYHLQGKVWCVWVLGGQHSNSQNCVFGLPVLPAICCSMVFGLFNLPVWFVTLLPPPSKNITGSFCWEYRKIGSIVTGNIFWGNSFLWDYRKVWLGLSAVWGDVRWWQTRITGNICNAIAGNNLGELNRGSNYQKIGTRKSCEYWKMFDNLIWQSFRGGGGEVSRQNTNINPQEKQNNLNRNNLLRMERHGQ